MPEYENVLMNWVKEHNILARFSSGFEASLTEYSKEEPEEYYEWIGKYDQIPILTLDKVSYNCNFGGTKDLESPDCLGITISLVGNINLDDGYLGWYKEVFLIDGSLVDEDFVIDRI